LRLLTPPGVPAGIRRLGHPCPADADVPVGSTLTESLAHRHRGSGRGPPSAIDPDPVSSDDYCRILRHRAKDVSMAAVSPPAPPHTLSSNGSESTRVPRIHGVALDIALDIAPDNASNTSGCPRVVVFSETPSPEGIQ